MKYGQAAVDKVAEGRFLENSPIPALHPPSLGAFVSSGNHQNGSGSELPFAKPSLLVQQATNSTNSPL